MKHKCKGFGLAQLLMATALTLIVGLGAFQLFLSNERVFADQNLLVELQESVRGVAARIAEEVDLAGQGVPVYSTRFDTAAQEGVQVILQGSNAGRIRFRAGHRNIFTGVNNPTTFTIGNSVALNVIDASDFAAALTGNNEYAYVYGPVSQTAWGWVRGRVAYSSSTLYFLPAQAGTTGLTFASPPTVSLEEGVQYELTGNDIVRGVTTDFNNLTSPIYATSIVGGDFTTLAFDYFDANGTAVTPSTLSNRDLVRRIDIRVVGQTSAAISDGSRPTFGVSLSVFPNNLSVK